MDGCTKAKFAIHIDFLLLYNFNFNWTRNLLGIALRDRRTLVASPNPVGKLNALFLYPYRAFHVHFEEQQQLVSNCQTSEPNIQPDRAWVHTVVLVTII